MLLVSSRLRDGLERFDGEEGMLSAVLDMDEVELFLSGRHHSALSKEQLIMPGAQEVQQLQHP